MYKVLVIAYYFPPMGLSGVQRTLKFVKYMPQNNWQPVVLTSGNAAYYAKDESLYNEFVDTGIEAVRTEASDPNSLLKKYGIVKIPSEFIRKILNRLSQSVFIPDNKISWSSKAYEKASQMLKEQKFDAVFITAPPFSSFSIGVKLKKEFNIPVFLDYRDLWYDSYFAFYPTPIHKWIHKQKEYKALKAADKIFVTNRKIKEKLLNDFQFLTFEDVVIISHGYDKDDFAKAAKIEKTTKKMIITYSGIFMEYCTPVYFLRAFKKLSVERPDIAGQIELHFLGYLRKENKKLVSKLKLDEYIKDFGYLNHLEAISKLLSADVLWFNIGRKRNIEAILPGKVYEYFGSKKPVIACVPDGAAKTACIEYKASFITEPDDIDEIKDTIIKVYELYREEKLPVPDEEYVEKFRRDFLTELLTKQFQFSVKEIIE